MLEQIAENGEDGGEGVMGDDPEWYTTFSPTNFEITGMMRAASRATRSLYDLPDVIAAYQIPGCIHVMDRRAACLET